MNNAIDYIRKEFIHKIDYVTVITNLSISTMISINRLRAILFFDAEPTKSELEKLRIYIKYHQ